MFNLESILVVLSVVVIGASIWGTYYFIGRIIYTLRDRWDEEKNQELIEQARRNENAS